MRTLNKAFAGVAAAATLAGAMVLATPGAALADYGCGYPRVCFYQTYDDFWSNQPSAAYQDVTSSWQTLGSRSRGAAIVYNSRHDDGALLHFTNGRKHCVKPGEETHAWDDYGTADKIMIMNSANCGGQG